MELQASERLAVQQVEADEKYEFDVQIRGIVATEQFYEGMGVHHVTTEVPFIFRDEVIP